MIISHRHRFIFVHCRKSAGSAVKVSLARFLGPRDFQLGVWGDAADAGVRPNPRAWLEMLRPGQLGFVTRQRLAGEATPAVMNRAIKRAWRQRTGLGNFPAARDVRRLYPREWADYHKFCIVRNPFDRIVSDYFYRTKKLAERPPFADFVAAMTAGDDLGGRVKSDYSNWDMYTIDDEIAVDTVLRFEDLEKGLQDVLPRIGVPWDGWLPRTKAGASRPRAYRELYAQEQIDQVRMLCRHEIETFGYEF